MYEFYEAHVSNFRLILDTRYHNDFSTGVHICLCCACCQNIIAGYKMKIAQIQSPMKEFCRVMVRSDSALVSGKQFEIFRARGGIEVKERPPMCGLRRHCA
jgi:hypothetical protein